jgi:Rab family protein
MDAGDVQSVDHIPIACKDAVAILYMFDLTSRCTLNKYVFRSIPNSSDSEH